MIRHPGHTLVAGLIAFLLLGATHIGLASSPHPPAPSPDDRSAKWSSGEGEQRALENFNRIDSADRAALLANLLLDGEVAFLIVLDQQADLRAASAISDKAAKGRFVFDALRAVAAQTQPGLIDLLRARGAAVRPFIIVNAIGVRGNLQSLIAAAEFPHTARIVADTPIRADLPSPDKSLHPSAFMLQPSAIEWGINYINAPAIWSMGYTGTGIVVGGQDTGVLWNHTALKNHYRGWNGASADHNFNWHDSIHVAPGNPCGVNTSAPCDDNGHGTHTVGTIAGDDGAGNQIGVAPGVRWIAANGCCPSDDALIASGQWFLEPTD
ncbi:MAG: S8 family serine peptidase, partial [Anaerolineae bacterium]